MSTSGDGAVLKQDAGLVLNNYAWTHIGCSVSIPEDWIDFFDLTGRVLGHEDERRRFARYHFRHEAVLIVGGTLYCIYTSNLSRSGIAFLHGEELPRHQACCICLASGAILKVDITRCRRVAENCYECGAGFVSRTDGELGREAATQSLG